MPWTFPVGSMVSDNRSLALRVRLPKVDLTKTIVFDAQMSVGEACERIRAQLRESEQIEGSKDYGLFLAHLDNKKGLWLDNARSLEHYMLRNGDTVEYRFRYRWLYIRTMDGTRKTLRVDDSKSVAELMLMICTKMGIYNHDEYSLVRERDETDRSATLRRVGAGTGGTVGRDQEKMEKLKRKLHTDDEMDWLNPSQSLRQQGIEESEILLLKRRYFFSDMNVDARDPVQLNLLYVQLKDAILKGTHPVSLEEAIHLAAIQCQVQFGNYSPDRFKVNFLDLKDFLPKEYLKLRNLEKKIFQQHAELNGVSDVDAKVKYCQFCRSLKTYGITFFLVKERIKGKNKLIPRLLGVTKDGVIRLDEKTKEVLKIWPFTSISRWAASLHAFTIDFGEYSPDDCYTAQTFEGEQISQLVAGYVDIITKKQKAKDHPGIQGDEESAMYEENVRAERATIVHHQRLPPPRVIRAKDALVNGSNVVDDEVFIPETEYFTQYAAVHSVSNGSRPKYGEQLDTVTDSVPSIMMVDGQSGAANVYQAQRQTSPDNFMIGGTHIFHYQELSPSQRILMNTINEDMQVLQVAKEQLDIGPAGERVLMGVGSDESSKRWLSESMGASQAKVTDEMGAMNAAVAQALRSANKAESYESGPPALTPMMGATNDPGDDLMMMQQSFRVVTIHFPAFVDDVKRVAVLRREAGVIRADQVGEPVVLEESERSTQNLLSAARHVADAFTDLLESAKPLATGQTHEEVVADGTVEVTGQAVTTGRYTGQTATGPVSSSSRKAIIEAASRVGEASNDLLHHVIHDGFDQPTDPNLQLITEEERAYQDQLLNLAKAVANATAGLVVKAKNLATQPTLDPESQQRVISAATQTGLCTSQLVACTKVLAPTIHQPSCQQQLTEAAREVTWSVDGVVQASRAASMTTFDQPMYVQQTINNTVSDTEAAATEVRDALDQLNAHLLKVSSRAYGGDSLDTFQMAYDELQQCHGGDSQRLVTAARRLAQATAQMISDIKVQTDAPGIDAERQKRLIDIGKQLSDATAALIASAKACSSDQSNFSLQTELINSAEHLSIIVHSSASELWHTRLIRQLQVAARACVTGATQLVNVSQVAVQRSRGNPYQMMTDAKLANSLIPRTVISIRDSQARPDDPMTQVELIGACERFIQPCSALVRSSRSTAPTVSDPTVQSALDSATGHLASAIDDLRFCLSRIGPLSQYLLLEAALARLSRLAVEAAEIESGLQQGVLTPLPDEKLEDCYQLLNVSVHDASLSTQQLQSIIEALARLDPEAVNLPGVCGPPSIQLASAIAGIVQATRGVVAHEGIGSSLDTADSAADSARRAVTQDTRQAVQLAYELVKAAGDARMACDANQTPTVATVLSHSEHLSAQLLDTLTRCLRGLPGYREISEATHLIEKRRASLVQLSNASPARTVRWAEPAEYELAQSELTRAAVEFNQATGDLLSSYSPGSFRRTTRRFTGAYDQLTDRGVDLSVTAVPLTPAEHQQPPPMNQELVNGLINVSDQSYRLMSEAGHVCAAPEQSDLRSRFQSAARDVTESISQLLSICTFGTAADHRDCEMAIRRLEAIRPLLENPNRPINQQTYHECRESVAKSISPLPDSLRAMSNSAKERQTQEFGLAVRQCSDAICNLIQETAQAAYLIGLSDPRADKRRRPSQLVNTQLLIRTQNEIQQVCDTIYNPEMNNRQVIELVTEMARSAKVLCETCVNVSAETTDARARQQLKELTTTTMQSITTLIQQRGDTLGSSSDPNTDGGWTESNRLVTLNNAQNVSRNVADLVQLVTTGPYATGHGVPMIGAVMETQQPVCSAGLSTLNAAQAVLRAAQTLLSSAHSGQAESAFLAFSSASRDLSESIKVLACALREHAPGQLECQSVLENIVHLMKKLQQAKVASMQDRLELQRELNEEGYQKQLATSLRALLDSAPLLGRAARSEAEHLSNAVLRLDSCLPGMCLGTIAAASRSALPSTQLVYLEHAIAILEAAEQLVTVARDCGGNPKAVHLHGSLDEAVRGMTEACEDLLKSLDDIASRQGHVSTLIDTLNRALSETEDIIQLPVDARFAEYQARLLRIARHMEQINQAIQIRARQPSSEGELTPLAHTLTQEFQEMCQTCKGAAATLPDMYEADRLRAAVRAVGMACTNLVQATTSSRLHGITGLEPTRTQQQQSHMLLSRNRAIDDLDKRSETLDMKLRELINLLDLQGPNTQACLQAANTVSGIIADLDTTILFASSGTLHAPVHDDVDALIETGEYKSRDYWSGVGSQARLTDGAGSRGGMELIGESFVPVKDSIARAARALMDDTHSLVSGTGEDQTRLASTAHIAVERVTQLADVVKRGAAVIGPGQSDTQVELLTCGRDVTTGLRNLLLAASKLTDEDATQSDRIQTEISSSGQQLLCSIKHLLNKIVAIADDEYRGVQALTAAIKYCHDQAAQLTTTTTTTDPSTPFGSRQSVGNASAAFSRSSSLLARYLAPDDMARVAGAPVQSTVSKAILAGSTLMPRDILSTAITTRDVVTDLVAASKTLIRFNDGPLDTRVACVSWTKELVEEFARLLESLKTNILSDDPNRASIPLNSNARRIADLSRTLVNLLESLRQGPRLVMYFRASSPEWRDVAEKYIGRHVAYHNHYVPNYTIAGPGSSKQSVYVRPSCYPLRMLHKPRLDESEENETEVRLESAIAQLDSNLEEQHSDCGKALIRVARSVAVATRELIETTRSIGIAPSLTATDRARRAAATAQSSSAYFWRAELTVSLAVQDMCQLAQLCTEIMDSDTAGTDTRLDATKSPDDVFGQTSRLVPSRERLLAVGRQVATACAQLLLSAKARTVNSTAAEIQKLQLSGQKVKEATDRLSSTVQRSRGFTFDPVEMSRASRIRPALKSAIETHSEIETQRNELEQLEQQLSHLRDEQARAHPDLFPQDNLHPVGIR